MTDLEKQILAFNGWRQCIELKNGLKTLGRVDKSLWQKLSFTEAIKGKTFLDIGANDGLFSFMAESKGAAKVVASDLYSGALNEMDKGWSSYGIELLKKYFNSSIEIHSEGIYYIDALNEHFDVVLVNHVINWLDDLEGAVKKLALVTAKDGEVIISDGFLLESNDNNFITPKDMPIKFLYKTSYLKQLLVNNGFQLRSIKEINYQPIFINDFLNVPTLKSKTKIKIYELPEAGSNCIGEAVISDVSYFQFDNFYHVFQKGWVHKTEVEALYHKPSFFYRLSKAIFLLPLFYSIKSKQFKLKNKYSYFVVKAVKI